MGCDDEVLKIKKKLDKMTTSGSDQTQALDLLKVLQTLPINFQVLSKTRIGMTVNALRRASSDDDVISTAKQLIKNWKKFVPDKKEDEDKDNKEEKKKDKEEKKESKSGSNSNSNSNSSSSGSGSSKPTSFPPSAPPTTDALRLKCREMLTNALKCSELPDGIVDTPESLGEQIEEAIYQEYRNTDAAYKNRLRSRVYNLKDSKNPQLRENVLRGVISPKRLATMSSDEMASDEMKALREKFTKEAIDDHQLAVAQGTKTDLLKCGKCGQRDCTYNQMQTRSSDEPMTTFVLCNHCGNRWKFC
ncbi:transcription elongation factor S-II-like [Penaeus monodon]|uniref:transcription elongation factor S-II-like n=1 Tax=Penaeus monodon TaxID=6687 RepID=UPI0018A77FBD|nr:transcription elongation factor S-II-like [Penaeus monodon]